MLKRGLVAMFAWLGMVANEIGQSRSVVRVKMVCKLVPCCGPGGMFPMNGMFGESMNILFV